jgi:outer membrane beta-barrel protein
MNKKITLALFFFLPSASFATSNTKNIEKVEIDDLSNSYWNEVSEVEVGVVQNRIYTKKKKIEVEALAGIVFNNPFINTYNAEAYLGYHFNELFSLHFNYSHFANTYSSSYFELKNQIQTQDSKINIKPEINLIKHITGMEARASLMYGKISFLGKAIQYFDAFASFGIASLVNQTNHEIAYTLGIGQQFHILRSFSFLISYKLITYKENIAIYNGNTFSHLSRQTNYSHNVTAGFCLFFGPLF